MVNLKIFRHYVFTCELIGVTPSFKDLKQFKIFYTWGSNNNGRC